jgi:hypothetical protein
MPMAADARAKFDAIHAAVKVLAAEATRLRDKIKHGMSAAAEKEIKDRLGLMASNLNVIAADPENPVPTLLEVPKDDE